MLHVLSRNQLIIRALLCLGSFLVALLWAGIWAAIAALGGVIGGLLLAALMVRLARPNAQAGELKELEPALIPVLAYGVADPKNQLRASLLELVAGGHFTLEEKEEKLWIGKGDEGVELGPCGEVVETRVRGKLMDGEVRLDGLVGNLASAKGRTISDLKTVTEKSSKEWTTPILVRIRLGLSLLALIAGVTLLALSVSAGGAGLGLAAGLWFPLTAQLRRLTPAFQETRQAWIDHLGDARVGAPSIEEWAPLMGLSLALGEDQLLEQMSERIKARKGRDKPLERLLGAALLLKD